MDSSFGRGVTTPLPGGAQLEQFFLAKSEKKCCTRRANFGVEKLFPGLGARDVSPRTHD